MTTLFGGDTIDGGDHNGFRLAMGGWLNDEHTLGVEGDYFDLSPNGSNYNSGLNNGYPALVRPIFDSAKPPIFGPEYITVPPGKAVSIPLVGSMVIQTSDYFQSAGFDFRRNLLCQEWAEGSESSVSWLDHRARTMRIDGLLGYRFYRLCDSVSTLEEKVSLAPGDAGHLFDTYDAFRASNQFNGLEMGFDAAMARGRWSLDFIVKVAMGNNHEVVDVLGTTQQTYPSGVTPPPTPMGWLSRPDTNAGTHSRDQFVTIPKISMDVGYQVTSHWKLAAGYDLLYWDKVMRTGEQISDVFDPPGTGPNPMFPWKTTSYWAQGLRVSSELRY